MPLTDKGRKIMSSMMDTYKSPEKAKSVFHASKNAGKISGVDRGRHRKRASRGGRATARRGR